ncbi:lipocalin family protein [Flavobacterium wongokense]|uniref:lipocalin family protein n=1 Tax=Flavobacterium wongokense TaxID=2910674 RepID=UPI001F2FA520|nr:lipocalin family protein [Flavobacterium sp. WG47]MCF6132595.1 lipocalin family protein [Flavobacterium sp. WG47]
MRKTIFTIMAAASLAFASCADKTNKTEGDAAGIDSTLVDAPIAEAPKEEASVVGVWKLTDMDMGMEIPKGKEKQFEEMMAKMKAETSFTFNEDGTMSGDNPAVKGMKGTYTYADSKLTIIDDKTKKEEVMNVDELSADKLVISNEHNGKKAVMTFSK